MISCAAANEIRCVNPSSAMTSPSWTCAATASRMETSLSVTQQLVHHGRGDLHVFFIHHQGRCEPDGALAGSQEQDALLERAKHNPLHQLRAVQFHADHESASAHVCDGLVLFGERLGLLH